MHPLLEQIIRARFDNIQESAFKRWQNELRDTVQPMLDRVDVLEQENAALKEAASKKGKKPEVTA